MRVVLLAIAASLALMGCGKKQATENSGAVDQTLTAEDFATNDATVIDAATGADANMAADIDINFIENADERDGNTAASRSRSRERSRTTGGNPTNANDSTLPATETAEQPADSNSN